MQTGQRTGLSSSQVRSLPLYGCVHVPTGDRVKGEQRVSGRKLRSFLPSTGTSVSTFITPVAGYERQLTFLSAKVVIADLDEGNGNRTAARIRRSGGLYVSFQRTDWQDESL